MTGVSHGADAERLEEISERLHDQGERVGQIGETLGVVSGTLREAWSGPDMEHLLAETDQLRPAIARTGASLVAWAGALREQADQQVGASGGASAPGGAAAGARAGGAGAPASDPLRAMRSFADFMGRGADDHDRAAGSPLLAALDPGRRPASGRGGSDWDLLDPVKALAGDRGKKADLPKGSYSESESRGKVVKLTLSAGVTHADAGVNDKGQSLERTTLTGTAELSVEAKARLGKVGVDAKGFAGTENTYSATAPKGTDMSFAHPLDPESLPEGTSLRLSSAWYKGYELGGSYAAIVADMGSRSGTEHYVEITRGPGDEVTVRVGNDEFDKAASSLGLGGDKASVSLNADSALTNGKATEVTFDLSTKAGQDAYDQFVFGGKAPAAGDPGVVDVAKIEAFQGSKSTGFTLAAGDKSLGGPLTESMNGGLTTTHADGTQTVAWSSSSGRNAMDGELTLDKSGNVVPGSEVVHLRRGGVDPSEVESYMKTAHGSDVSYSERQNVVITYSADDLRALREQAAAHYTQELNDHPGSRGDAFEERQDWTVDEFLERIDSDEDAWLSTQGFETPGLVVGARTDEEMLRVLAYDPIDTQRDVALAYRGTGKEPAPIGEVTVKPAQ